MIDPWLGSAALVLALLMDGLLAMARGAMVNSRVATLQAMHEQGIPGAARAERVASESTRFLTSVRFGLGALRLVGIALALALFASLQTAAGEPLTLMGIAAVVVASGLLIGLVEFIAEHLVMRDPEKWAIRLRGVAAAVVGLLSPIGSALLRLAGLISGASDGPRTPLVTEEEIMTLVDAGEEGGVIEQDEKDMIYSIFRLDDTLAREVMVPRIDLLALEEGTSLIEATDSLLESGFSRAPVFRGNIDNVRGLVYIKDLLAAWRSGDQQGVVGDLMREAYFIPEAKKVDDLLEQMQARRVHMAIVVDEYGGTAGVVTIEDIVEEIIGEIRDEYDFAEEARFQEVSEGEYIFSGGIDLDDVNQIAGAGLPKETSETLGGFIYGELGRVPSPGDTVKAGGMELTVDQVVRRRIRRVKARRVTQAQPSAEAGGPAASEGEGSAADRNSAMTSNDHG